MGTSLQFWPPARWPPALRFRPLSTKTPNGSTPSLSSSPSCGSPMCRAGSPQAEAQFATSGVSASLTRYYHVITSLPESVIVRIPDLLTPPADDPYSPMKARLLELYDMNDFEKAELLNALPAVDGDMRPSMLLDRMRALTPTNELDNPNSLFWYAFLSRLPPDIRVSCVPFVGVETLAD